MNNWYDIACMSNLSDGAKILYIRLCGYEANYTEVCPTIEQLGQDINKSSKTVIKYLQELKDANLVTITQQQAIGKRNGFIHNKYNLHPENIPQSQWTPIVKSKLSIIQQQLNNNKKSEDAQIEQLFNSYTTNDELYNTLMDFVEHRKELGSPLTLIGSKKILEKLNECKTEEDKINTINKAIINGWKSIYPNCTTNSNKGKQPAQFTTSQTFTTNKNRRMGEM